MLKKHGIRNAGIIADLMTHRDWDDLYSLTEYLRLSRVTNDKILLILEDWATHRRIEIPDDLLDDLNAPLTYVPPPISTGRGYSYPRSRYRRPHYESEDEPNGHVLYQLGRELGELKASIRGGAGGAENSPILQHILDRLSALEEKLVNRHDFDELADIKERLLKLENERAIELKKLEIELGK